MMKPAEKVATDRYKENLGSKKGDRHKKEEGMKVVTEA